MTWYAQLIAVWLLTLACTLPALAAEQPSISADGPAMRGVTISCFRSGPGEWDGPQMPGAIDEVANLGANWISFHPYARIDRDGRVTHRNIEDDASVLTPLRLAKQRGIKVMVIPHIGYWRSAFAWRGAIQFDSERRWRQFFAEYTDFIVHQARLAQQGGAAMFCIGIEYKSASHRTEDWRRVIAAVREVYDGPVTYAANWDEYERVRFWDAVDYIGIQGYFPIADGPTDDEDELRRGWSRVLSRLDAFAARHDKPVVLTELGYPRWTHAPVKPWRYDDQNSPAAEAMKRRCMGIALEMLAEAPHVAGVFLWKWFPTDREISRDFALQYPAMKDTIRNVWQR